MRRTLDSFWKSTFVKGSCLLVTLGSSAAQAQQSGGFDSQGQSSQQNDSQSFNQNQGSFGEQRQRDNQPRDQIGQSNDQSSTSRNEYQSNSQYGDARNQSDPSRTGNQQPSLGNQNTRRQDQPAGLGVSISESGQQGVIVEQVHSGSPAQQAGIHEGDRIVRISGRQVRSVADLLGSIQNMDPGQRVQIEVLRDGREQTLTATLETRREALMPQQGQQPGWPNQPFPQTPWGADQIAEHIQSLEQEIRFLTQEVQSLRAMIGSDPDYRGSEQSGSLQNQRMSQRTSNERPFDGFQRQNNQLDNSQRFPGQGSNQPQDSQPRNP